MEKIYNETELNFLLSKKGSQNLVVKADSLINTVLENSNIANQEVEAKNKAEVSSDTQ